jgi:hypothetical protein
VPRMIDRVLAGQTRYPYFENVVGKQQTEADVAAQQKWQDEKYDGKSKDELLAEYERLNKDMAAAERRLMQARRDADNRLATMARDAVASVPAIDITNVYRLTEEIGVDLKKLGCIRPRWDACWMELRLPPRIGVEGFAALISTTEEGFDISMFASSDGDVIGPTQDWKVALDEDGAVAGAEEQLLPGQEKRISSATAYPSGRVRLEQNIFAPFHMALALLHCKNVELETSKPAAPLSKKWKKKTGNALVEWTNVVVQVPGRVVRRAPGVQHAESDQRLHIVQGHFSEYGERYGKGKLFGRLEGRYWVPSHVRGNAEVGTLAHDYKLVVS